MAAFFTFIMGPHCGSSQRQASEQHPPFVQKRRSGASQQLASKWRISMLGSINQEKVTTA